MGKLEFDGVEMPAPSEVSFTNNKIWSSNTGRSADCRLVGDLIGIKKTITLKWFGLTGEQTAQINSFISNIDRSFFDVTIPDETFAEKTYTVYAGDPAYEVWGWTENRRLCKGIAVNLIEV